MSATNTRAFSLEGGFTRNANGGDLVVNMAFASETPYQRWWGTEVLQVTPKAVRLQRLNDGAPLLFNHDWNDLRGVHVPGSVRPEADGVLRGQVRITSATAAGRDAIALVESRVLTKASVGYQIHKVVEKTTNKAGEPVEREIDGAVFERAIRSHAQVRDGRTLGGDLAAFRRDLDAAAGGPLERAEDAPATYLVTDWEPLENSLVTVPADNGVGVGRSSESRSAEIVNVIHVSSDASPQALRFIQQAVQRQISTHQPAAPAAPQEKATMAETTAAAGASAEAVLERTPATPRQGPNAAELEQARVRGIENLAQGFKIDANVRDYWINSGVSLEAVSDDILRIQKERTARNPAQPASALGLSAPETRRFSMLKAVQAAFDNNWTNAGFELECSRAIAARLNVVPDPKKFYVPLEVQQRGLPVQRRDLTAASASGGGYLVGTDNMSFIELMRNRSVVYNMGATRMGGLTGNVTIPKQTGSATAVWLANEASTATESAQTFGQLALTPKTVGAYSEISRQLMLQSSPDAEALVQSDLATVCALAIDVGALRGSGSGGEPSGIVGTSGIGSVTGTSLAAAGILEFQSDVAGGNLLSASCGYVTTPAVAALLMARPELPSTGTTRLWQGSMLEGSMFGMRAMASNQMSSATMLFGDFSKVVIGEWGVLQVEVNPYANFQAGIVGVRALVTIDVGVRYGGAFSYASSIT